MRSHALVLLAALLGGCGAGAARSEPRAYFGTGGGNYHLVLEGDQGTLTYYSYERGHFSSGESRYSIAPDTDSEVRLVCESGTTSYVVRFVGAEGLQLFVGPSVDPSDDPIHLQRTASLDSGSKSFKV
jgi:hypothetical protein